MLVLTGKVVLPDGSAHMLEDFQRFTFGMKCFTHAPPHCTCLIKSFYNMSLVFFGNGGKPHVLPPFLLKNVPHEIIKIVDVKCPDSGEGDTFQRDNLQFLTGRDELKFVLASRADYEFADDFVKQHELAGKVNAILFSPAFRKDATGARDSSHCLLDPRQLAEWMIADNVPARLGLQLHKFIWDPAVKGV